MLAASTNIKSAKVVLPVEFDLHQTETVVGDNLSERTKIIGAVTYALSSRRKNAAYARTPVATTPQPHHTSHGLGFGRPVRHSASTVRGPT